MQILIPEYTQPQLKYGLDRYSLSRLLGHENINDTKRESPSFIGMLSRRLSDTRRDVFGWGSNALSTPEEGLYKGGSVSPCRMTIDVDDDVLQAK